MKNLREKTGITFILLAFMALFFSSCSDDDSNSGSNPEQGKSKMNLRLVDDPGDYDEVNVDVESVYVKYSGEENEVEIDNINAGVYNLLELTGGVSVMLAEDEEIPAGDISQIRLVLGDDNTIVVDGETKPLSTPSAQQSGLKLNLNATLEEGVTYDYVMDFDVEHSIVAQGNGNFSLKPVIRLEAEATTGIITGTVLPIGTTTLVTATSATDDTEISTYTNAEGEFQLYGVPEGAYTITLTPDIDLGFDIQTLTDIMVVNGEVTALGEINFE